MLDEMVVLLYVMLKRVIKNSTDDYMLVVKCGGQVVTRGVKTKTARCRGLQHVYYPKR